MVLKGYLICDGTGQDVSVTRLALLKLVITA